MSISPHAHWMAALAFERMLYCLTGGTVLGLVIWVVLRLLPGSNSRTRFAVWFSTLLAVALMPLIAFGPSWRAALSGAAAAPQHALITIPASWGELILLAWAAVALVGLARVAAGMWQLQVLRRRSVPIDANLLSRDSRARIAEAGKRGAVSVLVSSDVEVPTAIGFIRPAVVIPAWLAAEAAATDLEYVLLHELAHLRRWDDWSNLVQKLVKSLLFFHPAVWWIERELSLDREMACDDAVLAQPVNPRIYAECLARVAEKRFLRRQMALAQAAVDRVKQLSRRVARILDPDRGPSTRLWKPALPMVAGVAALCAVSTLQTPELVRLTEPRPATVTSASSNVQIPLAKTGGADPIASTEPVAATGTVKVVPARAPERTPAPAWTTDLKTNKDPHSPMPLTHHVRKAKPNPALRAEHTAPPQPLNPFVLSRFDPAMVGRNDHDAPTQAIVLVVATQRIISTRSGTLLFDTWEFRLVVPADHPVKPIPRKT